MTEDNIVDMQLRVCAFGRLGVFILEPVFTYFRESADGGKGRNSSLLALHRLAGMEQLTVSLSITHTPKPPYPPLPTSLPTSPQVRALLWNKPFYRGNSQNCLHANSTAQQEHYR